MPLFATLASMGTPDKREQTPDREAILHSNPFLRTFIDQDLLNLNQPEWTAQVGKHCELLSDGIKEAMGDNWVTNTLIPLSIIGEMQSLFDPRVPTKTILVAMQAPIFSGFEAGVDAVGFVPDITAQLENLGIFNPHVGTSQLETVRATQFTDGLVRIGIYFGMESSIEKTPDAPPGQDTSLNIFRDFINTL